MRPALPAAGTPFKAADDFLKGWQSIRVIPPQSEPADDERGKDIDRHSPDFRVRGGHSLPVDAPWQRVSSANARCRRPKRCVAVRRALELAVLPSSTRTSPIVGPPLSTPERLHAGAGGARRRAISDRISWNICRGTATSAIWKIT